MDQQSTSPPAQRPRPFVTDEDRFFWEAARAHRLAIQRCQDCGSLRHPPSPACAACRSLRWDAIDACGRGTLMSFTVIHAGRSPAFPQPYPVGLVVLEEGTRLVAELVGVPHEQVRIGMALQVEFLDCGEDFTLPVFRPAEAA